MTHFDSMIRQRNGLYYHILNSHYICISSLINVGEQATQGDKESNNFDQSLLSDLNLGKYYQYFMFIFDK